MCDTPSTNKHIHLFYTPLFHDRQSLFDRAELAIDGNTLFYPGKDVGPPQHLKRF